MHHADDVVQRAVVDRHAAVARLRDLRGELVRRSTPSRREDLRARRHHIAHDLLAEFDNAADDGDLLVFADALQLSLAQQVLDRVSLRRRVDVDRVRATARTARGGRAPARDDRRRLEGRRRAPAARSDGQRRAMARGTVGPDDDERGTNASARPATAHAAPSPAPNMPADEQPSSADPALAAVRGAAAARDRSPPRREPRSAAPPSGAARCGSPTARPCRRR